MKKVLDPIKKQYRQAKKHPKIAIPAVLAVVLLIGVLTALVLAGGDDGGDDNASKTSETKGDKKDPGLEAAKKRKVKPAPVVRGTGTLASPAPSAGSPSRRRAAGSRTRPGCASAPAPPRSRP